TCPPAATTPLPSQPMEQLMMIQARGLVQTFNTRQGRDKVQVKAVDGVDLDVADGEIVGFLGPNGAGKTTTLRMLTTLRNRTARRPSVAGNALAMHRVDGGRSPDPGLPAGRTFSEARAGAEPLDRGRLNGRAPAYVKRRGEQRFDQLDLARMWKRK